MSSENQAPTDPRRFVPRQGRPPPLKLRGSAAALAKAEGRRAQRVRASVLRPFDELRVAPSAVEGRRAQHALSSSKGGGGAPRALNNGWTEWCTEWADKMSYAMAPGPD